MTVAERIRLELPELHPAQQAIKDNAARFSVVACGRRFGKSLLGENLAAEAALEGGPVAWFSPTYKMLAEAWRDLKDLLQPVTAKVSEQEHRLELITGGTIECWSLDSPDTSRGRKYQRVIIDEAALVPGLLEVWGNVMRPTLVDLVGDAWFLSTPKGLNGFWSLYERGRDPLHTEWASFSAPTGDNPYIDAGEIERAKDELSEEAYEQEILARFLSQGVGVFRGVAAAMTATPQAERLAGHDYVFGVDWGQVDDFTAISVIDVRSLEQVAGDRFNQIEYHFQTARLAILAQKFLPRLIIAERNSIGLPMIERLQEMQLPVWGWDATNATVAAGVQSLSLGLQRAQLRLLPATHPVGAVQQTELLAYTAKKTSTGLIQYGASEGHHDDTVRALMLSWLGALTPDGRLRERDFRVIA